MSDFEESILATFIIISSLTIGIINIEVSLKNHVKQNITKASTL